MKYNANSINQHKIGTVSTELSPSITHAMTEYADNNHTVSYRDGINFDRIFRELCMYDKVIFNAAGGNYEHLIRKLARIGKEIFTIYHTSFCGFTFDHLCDVNERSDLQLMLDFNRQRIVKKIGFVNPGSAHFYARLGYDTQWVPNIPAKPMSLKNNSINRPDIGVFSEMNAMKNTTTAVAIALAYSGETVVHTIEKPFIYPGLSSDRVEIHGWQRLPQLLELMAKMDVNLMLSFTESYGLLVTQSWAAGTPCIVSPAYRPLLLGDDLLHEYCYVERVDDADTILRKIRACITARDKITQRCQQTLNKLRTIGKRMRKVFLDID
jgi:glycosyltransferase involved in cell wall biosynthesis